ncbi:hypothetical protein HYX11_04730 [Candidatus Woesearchaeota archaeon]|nr:hypothetical protein [Candidatus Woesearchaeota archaeon]
MPEDLSINGLKQWTFYILGWLFGSLNPLFWIMMYMAYLAYDQEEKFFNPQFHQRVYFFGVGISLLLIILYIITMIF